MEESEVIDKSFQLIFAFDEIVALGYRENVNLAQIRTFTEMESQEEKMFESIRKVPVLFWQYLPVLLRIYSFDHIHEELY